MSKKIILGMMLASGFAMTAFAATPTASAVVIASKAPKVESMPMPVLVERSDLIQAMPNALVFAHGESQINPVLFPILEWNAQYLRAFTDAKIEISGNADDYKSHEKNDKLSLARAQNVRAAFLKLGVQDQQMEIYALGDRRTVFKKDPKGYQMRNQRVDIFYQEAAPKGYQVEKVPVVMTDMTATQVIPEPIK